MSDELARTVESPATSSARPHPTRMELSDAAAAIARAERLVGSVVLGDPSDPGSAEGALREAEEGARSGRRVAVVARAASLAQARESMRRIARARLSAVAHAISGHGGEELAALADLGWAVLCASGPEESFDLALIARRASEDAGVPFLVVHAHGHVELAAGRAHAMCVLPEDQAVQAFVGDASRLRAQHDPAHPSLAPLGDRAFADRVPFALGSALREYATVSGRRHDAFDRVPLAEASLMLVGLGPVGDALFSATAELRQRGYDVGAIALSALRPFPGARLVKALARALAVTVLEPADEPMAHGGLLARELKSAFTDALTWAPGFPGIGRIPKLFVGVTGPSFDVGDLAAICDNMLADERGRRSFSFTDADRGLPPATKADATGEPEAAGRALSLRWVLDDVATADAALTLTSAVLASALGLRAHGIVTLQGAGAGGGATVDLLATREHGRGGMARRVPRLVLATARSVTSAVTASALAPGAVLGVLAAGPAEVALSDGARALVRERRVRALVLGYGGAAEEEITALAATAAGAALAAGARLQKAPLEPLQAARAVAEQLAGRGIQEPGPYAERARRAFEATRTALAEAERDGEPQGGADRARPSPVS